MKVTVLRNFSYGSTSFFTGQVVTVDESTGKAFIAHNLASEVKELGVPEGTPFSNRETKPAKRAKPLETK